MACSRDNFTSLTLTVLKKNWYKFKDSLVVVAAVVVAAAAAVAATAAFVVVVFVAESVAVVATATADSVVVVAELRLAAHLVAFLLHMAADSPDLLNIKA
jgi:hypothetical protein